MWLHILASPIGVLVLVAILFVTGLIANYPTQTFFVIVLIAVSYWIGAGVLGLFQ